MKSKANFKGYIKKSKLEAMKELNRQLGNLMDFLIEDKAVLICDNNDERPYQVIVNLGGDKVFDSRKSDTLSYECFEEMPVPDTLQKQGFQNFYKLRENYVKEYGNYKEKLRNQ
jgi:hypothetical protein